jgi:hypothetical protein
VETSEAKVGEIWGRDYYLFIPVIPSASIIQRHRFWCVRDRRGSRDHVRFSRRGGADMGIPIDNGNDCVKTKVCLPLCWVACGSRVGINYFLFRVSVCVRAVEVQSRARVLCAA